MRLTIEHRTTYRFTAPQARLVQLLRVTPENTHDQTIASWRIDLDRDATLRRHRDGFGNCTTMLYVEGPVDGIEITVHGEVVTSHSDGVLHGTNEPLPPTLFLRTTPLTDATEEIRAFAEEHRAPRTLRTLHALNRAICDRFTLDRGRGDPARTASEAFAEPALTSRDQAHLFIASARSINVPARYVSGYCLQDGEHRPTPHGWADAYVEGLGWVGFDPALGLSPEENHVRVAVALDAAGAAPVAGSRLGKGAEALDVDVSVSRED